MSSPQTRLEKHLDEANTAVQLATERLALAKASGLKDAIQEEQRNVDAAVYCRDYFLFFRTASKTLIKTCLRDIDQYRKRIDKLVRQLGPRSRSKELQRELRALERAQSDYFLICDRHGVSPKPLEELNPQSRKLRKPQCRYTNCVRKLLKLGKKGAGRKQSLKPAINTEDAPSF